MDIFTDVVFLAQYTFALLWACVGALIGVFALLFYQETTDPSSPRVRRAARRGGRHRASRVPRAALPAASPAEIESAQRSEFVRY